MKELKAFNFKKWIDDHRELLEATCGKQARVSRTPNSSSWSSGGPISRKDYHVDEGEEFFYQLEGDMVLKTMQDGRPVDIPIREGEIFLLPPRLPHSPQRFENTVGLVIERQRRPDEKDGLQWYCERCNALLYEEYFHLTNVETQFPPVFDRFFGSVEHRTCQSCGDVMDAPQA